MTRQERRRLRRARQAHAAWRCNTLGLTYAGRAMRAQAVAYSRGAWFASEVARRRAGGFER